MSSFLFLCKGQQNQPVFLLSPYLRNARPPGQKTRKKHFLTKKLHFSKKTFFPTRMVETSFSTLYGAHYWHTHARTMPPTPTHNTQSKKPAAPLRSSRAVPHPSTNRALRRLTSEFGRDPVHSTRYGRWRVIEVRVVCCLLCAVSTQSIVVLRARALTQA